MIRTAARIALAVVVTFTASFAGGVTAAALTSQPADVVQPAPVVERIEEDDPRWDCRTMGNRVCGPVVDTIVVEPGVYAEVLTVADPVDVVEL